jgi:hypothetical protein
MAARKISNKELRQRERYASRKNVFVALIRTDEPVVVGKVVDISLGGLGVEYTGMGKLGRRDYATKIMGCNKLSALLERIPGTVVYDWEIPGTRYGEVSMRRCGIKFLGTQDNFSELKEFMSMCTSGRVRNTRRRRGRDTNESVDLRQQEFFPTTFILNRTSPREIILPIVPGRISVARNAPNEQA